jgi:hypothetical protein
MTIEELRAEYAGDVIGGLILQEVERVVHSLASRYPPEIYARAASWDDAEADVVQGFVLEVLIGEHQLDYVMATALTLEDFRKLLAFQARRYLVRSRQRTIIDNLLDRAKPMLRQTPFIQVQGRGEPTYLLGGGDQSLPEPTDEQRKGAARAAAMIPRVPVPRGDKAPVVYSAEGLRGVLVAVGSALGGPFTLSDIGQILAFVLTDWVATFLEDIEERSDETRGWATTGLGPEDEAMVVRTMQVIVDGWSSEERLIIQRKLEGVSDEAIATELEISRPTVISRKKQAMDGLRRALDDLPPAAQGAVIDRISVQLATGGGV